MQQKAQIDKVPRLSKSHSYKEVKEKQEVLAFNRQILKPHFDPKKQRMKAHLKGSQNTAIAKTVAVMETTLRHWKRELESRADIFKVYIKKIKKRTRSYLMMIQMRKRCQII